MSHNAVDRASLEMGRRVAERLRRDPSLIDFAHANLERWMRQNADAPRLIRCYQEWLRLLDAGIDRVCAVLTDEGEEGQRLRQSSPFSGVLSPREVWEIKRKARDEQSAA